GGLIQTMPLTALAFLFCAFSVMGIPPFGGFFSKYLVFSGAVSSGHILIALTFLFGSLLTIVYLFRIFNMIFLGEGSIRAREGSATMVFSVAALAVLSILGGICISYPSGFVGACVKQMLGL
ncbi:MAG: proton-conducting transporter membrane subunit, partial [Candidatus Omnitrophica bacterium]|nr:proton-conducting transporter membrane subunit [Candidatus Omnitrophota bacterium]